MRKLLLLSATTLFVLALAGQAPADDPSAIIDKALKAHGGADKLAQFEKKAAQTTMKGKLEVAGGIDVNMTVLSQPPGKFKVTTEGEAMGVKFTEVTIMNGDRISVNVNGMDLTAMLGEKRIAEIKERAYVEKVLGRALLKDKSVELSALGEVQVNGKPAVGVRVSSKGHRDISLYFDKESSLMVKMEFRGLHLQSEQEANMETFFSDFKELGGWKRASKFVTQVDGAKFAELEILDIKLLDKIDDSEFAKP